MPGRTSPPKMSKTRSAGAKRASNKARVKASGKSGKKSVVAQRPRKLAVKEKAKAGATLKRKAAKKASPAARKAAPSLPMRMRDDRLRDVLGGTQDAALHPSTGYGLPLFDVPMDLESLNTVLREMAGSLFAMANSMKRMLLAGPSSKTKKGRGALQASNLQDALRNRVQEAAMNAAALASEATGLQEQLAQPITRTRAVRTKSVLLDNSDASLRRAIERDELALARVMELDDSTFFTVCPRTRSNRRIGEIGPELATIALDKIKMDDEALEICLRELESAGCRIGQVGHFGVSASAPPELLAELLNVRLGIGRSYFGNAGDHQDLVASELYVKAPGGALVDGARLNPKIHDFVFAPAPIPLGTVNHQAPNFAFEHLTSEDVRKYLRMPRDGADAQYRGRGVPFALVDTGFFAAHPFFTANRFQIEPKVNAGNFDPGVDKSGHGTMMAWNVFSVAPECRIWGYKHTVGAPQDALIDAANAGAKVISCSWGLKTEDGEVLGVVMSEIRRIIKEEGRIVLFASGNLEPAWPGITPEVISVGGMFMHPTAKTLAPSTFAQRFVSDGRGVPDVSGLCGNRPKGVYLPLPCPPGSEKDIIYGGMKHPYGDGVSKSDGWVCASGTSSATAQVAAVVALLVEKAMGLGITLNQEKVRKILKAASIPLASAPNASSGGRKSHGNDLRAGGLVDVERALKLVKP